MTLLREAASFDIWYLVLLAEVHRLKGERETRVLPSSVARVMWLYPLVSVRLQWRLVSPSDLRLPVSTFSFA